MTVSLPEDLIKRVKQLSRSSGLKVSRIVASALEEHLGEAARLTEPPIRPTVLWKLKGRTHLTAPSPTLRKARVGSWRIVEGDDLPV